MTLVNRGLRETPPVAATECAPALDPVISERVTIAQPGLQGRVLYLFCSAQYIRCVYELLGLTPLEVREHAMF